MEKCRIPSMAHTAEWSAVDHSFMFPQSSPLAMRLPSGDTATDSRLRSCPSTAYYYLWRTDSKVVTLGRANIPIQEHRNEKKE